jgi:hypothetical protein
VESSPSGYEKTPTVTLAQAGIDKNLAHRARTFSLRGITAPKKRKVPPFGSPFDSRLYRTLGRRPGSVGADPSHQTGTARANVPSHRVSYSVKYYRLCHFDDAVAKPQHKPR